MTGGGQVDQSAGGRASWLLGASFRTRELEVVIKCCRVRRFEPAVTGNGDCGTSFLSVAKLGVLTVFMKIKT